MTKYIKIHQSLSELETGSWRLQSNSLDREQSVARGQKISVRIWLWGILKVHSLIKRQAVAGKKFHTVSSCMCIVLRRISTCFSGGGGGAWRALRRRQCGHSWAKKDEHTEMQKDVSISKVFHHPSAEQIRVVSYSPQWLMNIIGRGKCNSWYWLYVL